ncbi:MAG: hypothetical protein PVF73_12660 [Bacteroidales bacterium]|jgi:hypothetical protein
MRNLLLLITLLVAIVFTGCEKEESEPAQTLSQFIVGVWRSDAQSIDNGQGGEMAVYYTASFYNNDMYYIEMDLTRDAVASFDTAGFTPFTVNNETNVISVTEPDWVFDNEPSTGEVTDFNVEWVEGTHTMTWTPVGAPEEAPLIWTFWHDIPGIEATHTLPD